MKLEAFDNNHPSPAPAPGSRAARKPGALAAALRTLLDCLAEVRDGAAAPGPDEAEVWSDPDFLYLEATVPHAAELEFDLGILDGRVFIRMAR